MAIKAISQLDLFNNNGGAWGTVEDPKTPKIGGNLRWLSAEGVPIAEFDAEVSAVCEYTSKMPINKIGAIIDSSAGCYSQALFELSRPLKAGDYGNETCDEWDTFKITYKQLAQNILADVVTYLHYKHQLSNINLYALVNGDYKFNGNKTFNGNLTIKEDLAVDKNAFISCDLSVYNDLSVHKNTTIDGNLIVGGPKDAASHGGITCYGDVEVTANHAKWSDLAEYYLADSQYEPGTLVRFGGTAEITEATVDEVNAVVTSKPAFLMNYGLAKDPNGVAIALAGRVPVKVIGKTKKFDKIVSAGKYGQAVLDPGKLKVIGIALEDNDDEQPKLVECVVKFSL